LAQQSEEIDFLKAELTSTKVRLHDALSHSQAEKDALIRHADASRAELLQQLEQIRREHHAVDESERQSSAEDSSESAHITPGKCHSDEALRNEHVPEMEVVSHSIDNNANLWKKLELLRELVKAEKEKWNLQQTGLSDSEQLNADIPDGTVNEVAHSHKIRSSWVVLEEQVLPLIEKFCTSVDQDNGPSNSEATKNSESVVEKQETGMLLGDGDGEMEEDKAVQSERGQVEEERQEVIRLKEVIDKMQDSIHIKDEAVHEMEAKCSELQVELDSVREHLQSQERLTENLSANVESVSEQLKQRTDELSDKDTNMQLLNAEIAELKGQITQKLLALQTDCDEKLDLERKTWQAQTDAKCAELEQHELTLKALSDQCSLLTAERDTKTAEIAKNNAQIDSLTSELTVVKEQLNDKTVELHEAQTRVEHERKLRKDETECETINLKSKVAALEDEVRTLQHKLESKTFDSANKDEALTVLEKRAVSEREEFLAKIADLENQLSSDQKLSAEKLDVLTKEVKAKEAALREHEEAHAAYCKLTDNKLTELSAAVSTKEDEMKSQLEHHKTELQEQCETFNGAVTKLTTTNEEQFAHLNSQIDELTKNKRDLESELQLLTDKLKAESENVERLEKEITELSLMKEECERMKEAALREHEEAHAAYCKLTDNKLTDLSAAVSAKEDELKAQLEHHKAELQEQRKMFNGEMAKLTTTNEEQLAHLNSQIDELTKNKCDLESELQLLTDKLKSESEDVARLEKEITELSLLKEGCERQLEDLRCTVTGETEQVIKLRDEQITALKSALSDKDHSLSLLNVALSQTCRENFQSLDSSSHTVVTGADDSGKHAEVSDAGSGDADHGSAEQLCAQNFDVPVMVRQITSLGDMNTVLREKIGRLEAELQQMKQSKPVGESAEPELPPLHSPPAVSHILGELYILCCTH